MKLTFSYEGDKFTVIDTASEISRLIDSWRTDSVRFKGKGRQTNYINLDEVVDLRINSDDSEVFEVEEWSH